MWMYLIHIEWLSCFIYISCDVMQLKNFWNDNSLLFFISQLLLIIIILTPTIFAVKIFFVINNYYLSDHEFIIKFSKVFNHWSILIYFTILQESFNCSYAELQTNINYTLWRVNFMSIILYEFCNQDRFIHPCRIVAELIL